MGSHLTNFCDSDSNGDDNSDDNGNTDSSDGKGDSNSNGNGNSNASTVASNTPSVDGERNRASLSRTTARAQVSTMCTHIRGVFNDAH